MRNKKRFLIPFLATALAMSVSACGASGNADNEKAESQTMNSEKNQTVSAEESAASESAETTSGERILIAYFTAAENSGVDAQSSASYSTVNGENVGRLRAIAEIIQDNVGGDLFSIQTIKNMMKIKRR